MKDYVLPAILILLILLVPDKVSAPHVYAFDERRNEGDIAFFVNDYDYLPNPDESEDCECGGTGKITTGDGRTFPCPCGDNCKCKKKAGQVQSLLEEINYDEYYIVKLTASWCGPCIKWNRDEKPKLEKVGLDVVEIDVDKNPDILKDFKVNGKKHNTIPAFMLCRKKDKVAFPEFNKGNVSGETLIKEVERLHKLLNGQTTSSVSPRLSAEELDAIVRSKYSPSTPLMKAVMGNGADVYFHLYNDHGFTKEQVMGLEYWVALALHDATHEPSTITPWR